MRTVVRIVLDVAVVVAGVLAAPVVMAAPADAGTVPPVCEQPLPTATDGTLTLDTPTVQAGSQALGILTGFARWPQALIGGGSGETFLSCAPWLPLGSAEVMPYPGAPLFLVDVPRGTPAGEYPVSVVFYEGSQEPFAPGDGPSRLSVTLAVSAEPVRSSSTGAACALSGSPAGMQELVGGDGAVPGGVARLTLIGPQDGWGYLNEYDRLRFVACVEGTASPVLHDGEGPAVELDVQVPATVEPGVHLVRLWGAVEGQVVWWERTITVAAPPDTSQLAVTGLSWVSVAVAGALLLLGGLAAVVARPGRRRA